MQITSVSSPRSNKITVCVLNDQKKLVVKCLKGCTCDFSVEIDKYTLGILGITITHRDSSTKINLVDVCNTKLKRERIQHIFQQTHSLFYIIPESGVVEGSDELDALRRTIEGEFYRERYVVLFVCLEVDLSLRETLPSDHETHRVKWEEKIKSLFPKSDRLYCDCLYVCGFTSSSSSSGNTDKLSLKSDLFEKNASIVGHRLIELISISTSLSSLDEKNETPIDHSPRDNDKTSPRKPYELQRKSYSFGVISRLFPKLRALLAPSTTHTSETITKCRSLSGSLETLE